MDSGQEGPQQTEPAQLRGSSSLPTPYLDPPLQISPQQPPEKEASVLPQKAVLFPGMIRTGKSRPPCLALPRVGA